MCTNDTDKSEAELLGAQKRQPHLERRHATFKGVFEAAPIALKSDCRIDAHGFCLYVALLVHALIEREVRQAMAEAGIAELPTTTKTEPARRRSRHGCSRSSPRSHEPPSAIVTTSSPSRRGSSARYKHSSSRSSKCHSVPP